MRGRFKWVAVPLLWTALAASGVNHRVSIGEQNCPASGSCFTPASLQINAGDSVTFFTSDPASARAHNVFWLDLVACDDICVVRCAKGCSDEGGDGTPAPTWEFTRTFNFTTLVQYHDEATNAAGTIYVLDPAVPFGPAMAGLWETRRDLVGGSGMVLQVLAGGRIAVTWLTFDSSRAQRWMVGTGAINGGIVEIRDVDVPSQGTWLPGFDPARVAHNRRGSLVISFESCNLGWLQYEGADLPRTGPIRLNRITQPLGTSCP